jgi:hypothetical protein
MDGLLNLALFVGVFYLILVLAGLPDRGRDAAARRTASAGKEKRVA